MGCSSIGLQVFFGHSQSKSFSSVHPNKDVTPKYHRCRYAFEITSLHGKKRQHSEMEDSEDCTEGENSIFAVTYCETGFTTSTVSKLGESLFARSVHQYISAGPLGIHRHRLTLLFSLSALHFTLSASSVVIQHRLVPNLCRPLRKRSEPSGSSTQIFFPFFHE